MQLISPRAMALSISKKREQLSWPLIRSACAAAHCCDAQYCTASHTVYHSFALTTLRTPPLCHTLYHTRALSCRENLPAVYSLCKHNTAWLLCSFTLTAYTRSLLLSAFQHGVSSSFTGLAMRRVWYDSLQARLVCLQMLTDCCLTSALLRT